jgi:plastocyanin
MRLNRSHVLSGVLLAAAARRSPARRGKAKVKRQKSKVKSVESDRLRSIPTPARTFAFCLLTFAFCLLFRGSAGAIDVTGRVVDANGSPLADAVVFIQKLPDGAAAPPPEKAAVMDQINKQFVPRVLPVAVGTAVAFPNHDQIHHHVYSFSKAKTFEIPLYKGEPAPPIVFDQPGAVTLGCNIHEWMRGVIVVLPTALFAVTGVDGGFTLHGVPSGANTIAVWHEGAKSGPEASAQVVEVGGPPAPLTFTLAVAPRRARAGGGLRSEE